MVTPFSKFQKIEDIEPLMDKEERLLYPLVDNTIMMLNKIIDPFEENIPLFDKNEATIVGLFIKQTFSLAVMVTLRSFKPDLRIRFRAFSAARRPVV